MKDRSPNQTLNPNSISSQIQVMLLVLVLLALSSAGQAQIVLNVSGGTDNTPLTINITTGANFTATANNNDTKFLRFINFWDNSVQSFAESIPTNTISLNGTTDASNTGAIAGDPFTPQDLFFGFGSSSFVTGNPLELSTGTRVTDNLSLDYTAVNTSGSVIVIEGFFHDEVSNTLTWTTVPEPSTYAAISCLICIGAAIRRRNLRHVKHSRFPATA